MTSPRPTGPARPGPGPGRRPSRGTERLPPAGAGVAEPDPDATGRADARPSAGPGRRPSRRRRHRAGASGGARRRRRRRGHRRATAPSRPAGRPSGRAGRNLGAAIGVGLALGAVILLSLLIWRPAFLAGLAAAILVAIVELTRALHAGRFRPPLVPVLVGAVAMIGLAWTPRARPAWSSPSCSPCSPSSSGGWRTARSATCRTPRPGCWSRSTCRCWPGSPSCCWCPTTARRGSCCSSATVVCNDVGGYAAGVLFGKHPMAPSISPKKSWEGLGGSLLACMLLRHAGPDLHLPRPWWSGLVFGAAIAASATIGDLGESLIKRDLGIKDMGHLLPGHGGIMDRLDSLLPSAAVAYLLLTVLAP